MKALEDQKRAGQSFLKSFKLQGKNIAKQQNDNQNKSKMLAQSMKSDSEPKLEPMEQTVKRQSKLSETSFTSNSSTYSKKRSKSIKHSRFFINDSDIYHNMAASQFGQSKPAIALAYPKSWMFEQQSKIFPCSQK